MSTVLRAPLKCTTPGCDCSGDGPFALYRVVARGTKVFTGLVTGPSGTTKGWPVRLDDCSGPLDGPGHTVTHAEYTAHLCFYPDSTLGIWPVALMGLLPASVASTQYAGEVTAHTKDDHIQVRSGDRVQVVMEGAMLSGQRAHERFWILVHAVIPHAPYVVLGTSTSPLNWLPAPGHDVPLNENVLVQVPMDRVLAIEHGQYW